MLFLSMILLANYAVVLAMHTDQHSQTDSRGLLHHQCPSIWFEYNPETQDCQCIGYLDLKCEGEHVYVDTRHILTYDSEERTISAVKMRHKYLKGYNLTVTKDGSHAILLPNNISELNPYMCGPLNRKDYLCSKCKNGYGPPGTSESAPCANVCYLCKDTWKDFLLYLCLNFIPLTLFYLVILVFQVRLTSVPMTCFIMYSQLVVLAFYEECGLGSSNSVSVFSQVKFTDTGETLRVGTKILLMLYGVFNLDFFRYIFPPFCLSSKLSPIHIFSLGYISALYPFLLVLLTRLCVELHGRNFRPIVWLWKPFHGCFVRLRRGWNTKSDLVDVFASFFLLSYSKILYQIMLTFEAEEITKISLMDGKESHDYVLKVDLSIVMFKRYDSFVIFMILFALLLVLLFVIFPVFLLIFYPTKILRKILSKCLSNRVLIFLNTFMEKFHYCYKDGLDDTNDMRSFSGIYFLLRIIIYSAESLCWITLDWDQYFTRGLVFSIAAILIALSRPCKKAYMNIMDCILLFHVATFCYMMTSTNRKPHILLPLMHIMIALPFIIILLLPVYRITRGIFRKSFSHWSPLQCLSRLKTAITKFYSRITSQSLTLPETTYGTIN